MTNDTSSGNEIPFASIEPHRYLLKQPSDTQKVFKIISFENFHKSFVGDYLHFQRVDTYRGPNADIFDGKQLPMDESGNSSSKFASRPSYTAANYYDLIRSRTYTCCFSLEEPNDEICQHEN